MPWVGEDQQGLFKRIFRRFSNKRGRPIVTAKPTDQVVEDANAILEFVRSPQWEGYSEYVEAKFISALTSAFSSLKTGDTNKIISSLSKAEEYWTLLRDVDRSLAVMRKISEVPNKVIQATTSGD